MFIFIELEEDQVIHLKLAIETIHKIIRNISLSYIFRKRTKIFL
jgi:hypothetical protein